MGVQPFTLLRKIHGLLHQFINVKLKLLFLVIKGRLFAKKKHQNLKEDYPIDFVVLWVDGSDPKWREKKAKYTEEGIRENSARRPEDPGAWAGSMRSRAATASACRVPPRWP